MSLGLRRDAPARRLVLLAALAVQACAGATAQSSTPRAQLDARDAPSQAAARAGATARARGYFADGLQFARSGDLVRAEQYLASAWRMDGQDPRILRTLLHICISASRLRAAATYAQAYLLAHPHAWQLRYVLASLDLALERRDDARGDLERVIEDAPAEADPYYLLATLATLAPPGPASAETDQLYAHYLALAPNGPHASDARRRLRLAGPAGESSP